jgi:acyl carrier protein
MTLLSETTFERIARIVRTTFRLPSESPLLPSTTSEDIDGWDSLTHSILIMSVEEEFEIELPFDRVFTLRDLGDLAELVQATSGALD